MKKRFIVGFILSIYCTFALCSAELDLDEGEEFDLVAEKDSLSSQALALWLVSMIGSATSSTSKLFIDQIGAISAHKDPERQGVLDRVLRKTQAVIGGKPVEAAKLGIHYPGISEEMFVAYESEGTVRRLVKALAAGESLAPQQVITLNRRASMAQALSLEVIDAPLPQMITELQQAFNVLDIGQQLIANEECRQLIPPCIFMAVKRKVPLLAHATNRLVDNFKKHNNHLMAHGERLQEEKNSGDL